MFLTTFIIALAIFFLGLWAGKLLDDLRIDDTTKVIVSSELDGESYIIERDFISQFGGGSCDLLKPRLATLTENLAEIGQTLASYDDRNLFDQELYDLLRRRYFLQEIKTYTLKNQLRHDCNNYNGTTILYFYDTTENEASLRQGYVLDALVKRRKDITVFSIDRTFKEPTLESVKQHYNITQSPTLIINNELKKEGFVSEGELRTLFNALP